MYESEWKLTNADSVLHVSSLDIHCSHSDREFKMVNLLGPLKSVLRLHPISIDSCVSKLHYRWTSTILIAFALWVAFSDHFGTSMRCQVKPTEQLAFESYCRTHSTYTLRRSAVHDLSRHPGYGGESGERVYHSYYQWVASVLFIQALFFLGPHFLWKSWEAGRMKSLVRALGHSATVVEDGERKKKKKKDLPRPLVKDEARLNFYFGQFFFCETLNLVNVVFQMWWTTYRFIGDQLLSYGLDWLSDSSEEKVDPATVLFPTLTKCSRLEFDSSGSVHSQVVGCVLPVNILNRYVYLFLWFWFIAVSVLTVLALLGYLIVLLPAAIRFRVMRILAWQVPARHLETVARGSGVGKSFVLMLLAKNLDADVFEELVIELAQPVQDDETMEPLVVEVEIVKSL